MSDDYNPETGEYHAAAAPLTHRWSQPCDKLFAALAKAGTEVKNAVRDSQNPHFRSRYADLAAVREACWEALTKNGLFPVQMPVNGAGANIGVVTLLTHSSGQWLESSIFVAPTKFDAQGVGSVITYLRRYALAAMAGVAPDDDDGEAAVGRPQNAPGRTEAPGGYRGRGNGASAPQRASSAAATPSETDADARKRWKELAVAIDSTDTIPELDQWMDSPAWEECRASTALAQKERGADDDEATRIADQAMAQLARRAEGRKKLLLGEMG